MAEREGFEPSVQFPGQQLSRLLHSTALAPLLKLKLLYHKKIALSSVFFIVRNLITKSHKILSWELNQYIFPKQKFLPDLPSLNL